jgi:hypothetical protein
VAQDVAVKAEKDKLEKEQRRERVMRSRELRYVYFLTNYCATHYGKHHLSIELICMLEMFSVML